VRHLIFPLLGGILCTSFTHLPETAVTAGAAPVVTVNRMASHLNSSALLYDEMNLAAAGLSAPAFELAYSGYHKLNEQQQLARSRYLTICDFSQSSARRRFYLIDMEDRRLLIQTWVAHGRNSGTDYATRFSNTVDSWQSSLGFYSTGRTYQGAHGLSLRLQGLEPGINDKAMQRSIVLHGATYVDGARARAGVMMGRSFGCPAVPQAESAKIINIIRDGSCLFIYHPSGAYREHSTILND
jgi:hypothetical protein